MKDGWDRRPTSDPALAAASAGSTRARSEAATAADPRLSPGEARLLGGPKAAAARRFGAKAATLHRVARAGAPTPPAWALSATALDAIRAADPADPEPLRRLLAAGLEALASAAAKQGRLARFGDAKTPLPLAVRLSPVTPLPDLAPAIVGVGAAPAPSSLRVAFWRSFPPAVLSPAAAGLFADDPALDAPPAPADAASNDAEPPREDTDAAWVAALESAAYAAAAEAEDDAFAAAVEDPMAELMAAVRALAAAWDHPRCRRRRTALGLAGEADGCGLILQAVDPGQAVAGGWLRLQLWDEKTGAPKVSGLFRSGALGDQGPAEEIPLDESARAQPALAAALAAAERAEDALGPPHAFEIALAPAKPAGRAPAEPGAYTARVLGARPLRPTGAAAVEIAVARAEAGRIAPSAAVASVPALGLQELLHPRIDAAAKLDPIAAGLPASPGAAAGRIAFSAAEAEALAERGEAALLVSVETRPEDVHGMHAAVGVLTTRGGLTSHAAVVARGLGRPCVVGAADAKIEHDADGRPSLVSADGRRFGREAWLTLDGAAGRALAGRVPTVEPEPTGALASLMEWADSLRRMKVRANADTPTDAETAARLGVDGIGLCRTEHMFFEPARITEMRRMILADDPEARRAALDRLLPMQRADFLRLFEIMAAMTPAQATQDATQDASDDAPEAEAPPVTIRLLDPPLHEFLPDDRAGLAAMAKALGEPVEKVSARAWDLREFNPMLGKRGCRVGVAFPEIYEMQARAIFEAALEAEARTGRSQRPEIMIPLVSAARELEMLAGKIDRVADQIHAECGARPDYRVGIMVETPRAALRGDALGALSAFFSFGTNDLTQMTYGLSRDDAGRLMRDYVERGVFEADPFQSLDQEGVGELIELAVARGRAVNPELVIGLCGEHGGDPATVAFCEAAGFDYVSCSAYRAPIARLAAAQAAVAAAHAEPEDD